MPFTQKDIVKIKGERLPEGIGPHPFLIINSESCISSDGTRRYLGVMLTHSPHKNKYTFEVKRDMIDGAHDGSFQQIRTNIIVAFRESDISPDASHYIGKMKPAFFKLVMHHIKDYTLQIDS